MTRTAHDLPGSPRRRAGHRTATPAVLAVAGGALAVATWIGGSPGWGLAVLAFYAVAATVASCGLVATAMLRRS